VGRIQSWWCCKETLSHHSDKVTPVVMAMEVTKRLWTNHNSCPPRVSPNPLNTTMYFRLR
jgi:hypothetical protein